MQIAVLTSDKTSGALPAFMRQWDKYFDRPRYPHPREKQDVVITGYTQPGFAIAAPFRFASIGEFKDYPVERWSDGVIHFLQTLPDELVLILLDDYWLTRNVDLDTVALAEAYMLAHPDVIRFDLTTDRLYDAHHELESIGSIDLIEADKAATYNLSFQASIWRRELLLEVLRPGETPWESEIRGSERLNRGPYRVVGTCQWPMRYIVAVNKGQLDVEAKWMRPPRSLSQTDVAELVEGGFIPMEATL